MAHALHIYVGLAQARTNYLSGQPATRPPGFNTVQTCTSLVLHTHSAHRLYSMIIEWETNSLCRIRFIEIQRKEFLPLN